METLGRKSAPTSNPTHGAEDRIRDLEEQNTKLRAELSELCRSHAHRGNKIKSMESLFNKGPSFAIYQMIAEPERTFQRARAVSYVSPNFKELTGINDPWDDNSWFSSMHPDDIKNAIAGHKSAAKTGVFNQVIRLFHEPKDEWRWFNLVSSDTGEPEGPVKIFNGIVIDVTEFKRTESRLLEYQKRLQKLTNRQFVSEEQGRRHVAEILHDEIGQDLALALFKLNTSRAEQSGNHHGPMLDEAAALIEKVISYTRTLTKELCPPALCQMGLKSGLEWLAARLQEQYKVRVIFKAMGQFEDIDGDLGSLIFRTIAELLNNVAKHAKASKAEVNIEKTDGAVRLNIKDDGVGFDYSSKSLHKSDGFGLFLISERMRNIGGRLTIKPNPGEGTSVSVDIPIR